MQTWKKRLLCIVFSFSFLFLCVGYAQIMDTLTITGSANAKYEYEGVYITDVSLVEDSASSLSAGKVSCVLPSSLRNGVTLTGNNQNASVQYKISVYNSSSRYTYTFKEITCIPELEGYNNGLFSTNASDSTFTVEITTADGEPFAIGSSIAPGEERSFYATYRFGSKVTKNTELSFLLDYKFSIHVASMGEMAVEKTLDSFLDILNTDQTYSTLVDKIDDKYKGGAAWTANYIGNVSNTSGNISGQGKEDAKTVEALFEDGLTLTIDNVTKNVTVIIKRENLDNNLRTGDAYKASYWFTSTSAQGCEMAIYMTPNNLDKIPDEGEYNGSEGTGWAEVYIAVSTCTNDGSFNNNTGETRLTSDWYQIGDIYAGIADIVTYDGGTGTGSFVTDHWKSTEKTYKVTENYSYTINSGRSLQAIIQDVDGAAYDEFVRLRNLANEAIAYIDVNISYFNAPEFEQPIKDLRAAAAEANSMTVNRDSTYRSSLIPILKLLENTVYPFQDYIQ